MVGGDKATSQATRNECIINLVIDYLKEGLDTPLLGVWNLDPSMKLGVYFKNSL